jgi:hypothetical protein
VAENPRSGIEDAKYGKERKSLSYAEMDTIEAGLRFKTLGELVVETTGVSQHIESTNVHVHEVVIVEGEFQGTKYLHNLDYAESL